MTAITDQARSAQTPGDEPEFEKLAKRVDDAMRALAGLDPMSRAVAQEVKDSVEAIHRAGLVSIVRRLKADEATREALFELVDDKVVHLLLSLHEIVRPDPMTLATRKVKTWDKKGALELCMRHLGMLNDKIKVDANVTGGVTYTANIPKRGA